MPSMSLKSAIITVFLVFEPFELFDFFFEISIRINISAIKRAQAFEEIVISKSNLAVLHRGCHFAFWNEVLIYCHQYRPISLPSSSSSSASAGGD
jgi:hypothetical protein